MEDSNPTNIRRRLSLNNNTPSPIPIVADSQLRVRQNNEDNNIDIDALLRQEEENDNDNNDGSNYDDNHTAISSLPPFQLGEGSTDTGEGGGSSSLRRTLSDFSSIGSSLGNLLDSNIDIDDDLECGPVPDYTEDGLPILTDGVVKSNIKQDKIRINSSNGSSNNKCPNEVYISTIKTNKKTPTGGKLSAYMGGMSRRHKSSDASIGGSSAGSNSLSSIFESIGYLKRNRPPHHSRGLTKKKEKGFFYRLLTGNTTESISFENEREEMLYRQREERMVNLRASILMVILVCVLIFVIELSSTLDDENKKMMLRSRTKHGRSGNGNENINLNNGEDFDSNSSRQQYNPNVVAAHLAKGGVPLKDEGPAVRDSMHYKKDVKTENKSESEIPSLKQLQFLSDVVTKDVNHEDNPLLWSIPQSGFGTIREILSTCLSYSIAGEFINFSSVDSNKEKPIESKLQVITQDNHKLLNVDLSTIPGIERAKKMNLVQSKMSDVIITPLFLESLVLFDEKNKARAFTLIKDPIDRAISTYEYLKTVQDPTVKNMSLDAYARSSVIENNWMVRYLSGKIKGELTSEHLDIAKDILKKKFIVGLYENLDNSLSRFEAYYGIQYKNGKQLNCKNSLMDSKRSGDDAKVTSSLEKELATSLLEWQNKLDLELYQFAKELYSKQGKKFFNDS